MGYTKVVKSGDIIEIYEYSKDLPQRRQRQIKKGPRIRISASRRADNVARLKRNFIRLVRSNLGGVECPSFLTLTMVEVVRVEVAYGFFTEFISRLRRFYGAHIRYITVPEFQERGAVHFHILIWGLSKETIENETPKKQIIEGVVFEKRGSRAIQSLWGRGYVDCIPTDGSPKLAFYVAKYMQKALQDDRLRGQKAYTCSRNVLRKVSIPSSSAITHSEMIFGLDLSTAVPLQEKNFDTYWLGKGRYRLFNIKP